MRGTVETWVNSQWKYLAAPGQLSVEINSEIKNRILGLRVQDQARRISLRVTADDEDLLPMVHKGG
jgi:hypothetical protein